MSIHEFQCWFCDKSIERSENGAVLISAEGLWAWAEDRQQADEPFQQIFAHTLCAKEKLKGHSMNLEPEIFGEV